MPWNLSSCSESSPNAGVSSISSSLISPRRWLLAALMDSFLDKPSKDVPSDRLANWMRLRSCGIPNVLRCSGASRLRDWGPEDPGQDVRSATEAAGAANVVDGTPPGERGQRSNGWTTHRPNRVRKNRLRCCDPVAKRTSRARCPAHCAADGGQGWASGFDIANHRPDGKTPTKTIGSLQGRGRSTVAV